MLSMTLLTRWPYTECEVKLYEHRQGQTDRWTKAIWTNEASLIAYIYVLGLTILDLELVEFTQIN